jgi:intein/homing endonuclease
LNGTNIEECSIIGIKDLTVQPEYTGESVQTYNLDVEDVDYYFANGILVHNKF